MVTKMNAANCLAKALYDNVAEAPDELAFRKGDILTVLEQNTNSLEGWWLCSLRGRQGIVPGNRLRLLPGMYDPSGLGNVGSTIAANAEDNLHSMRRSWTCNPNKVVTPQRIGAVYLYDVPVGAKSMDGKKSGSYSPRSPAYNPALDIHGGSYDTPPSPRPFRGVGTYDEPRSIPFCNSPQAAATYDSPRPNAPLVTSDGVVGGVHDYDLPDGGCGQAGNYDVPRSSAELANNNSAVSHIITITDNYDTPQPLHKSSPPIYDGRAFSRSSGDTSTSSSFRSPSGSHSSMETLSLSSVGGGSNRSSLEQHPGELYDIPPEPQPVAGAADPKLLPPPCRVFNAVPYHQPQETYDVPTNNAPTQFYDSLPSLPVRAVAAAEGAYDVPPQATRDASPVPRTEIVDSMAARLGSVAPSPEAQQSSKSKDGFSDVAELNLELGAAVEMLIKYHHEVQAAISKLFSFVCTTWRERESIESRINDIEVTCHRIQSSLFDFLTFAQGAVANSYHADDKTLSLKLCKLVKPLRDSFAVVKNCVGSLDEKGWLVQNLVQEDEDESSSSAPDNLDQIVACARGLVEDVRQIASLIQGNSSLLFKCRAPAATSETKQQQQQPVGSKPPVAPKPDIKPKPSVPNKPGQKVQERPLPPTPAGLINKEFTNEYDYVNLESKEAVERENEAIKSTLPKDMCKSFDELVKQSEVPVLEHNNNNNQSSLQSSTDDTTLIASPLLNGKDSQLLHFYGEQVDLHIAHLTNAIDAFLLTIKNNQPPKVFVGHSKFIIISAHKLVFIGDTVYRNVGKPELKNRVMQSSNELCDSLKSLVSTTKKAAAEFPSVVAVQEMVDSVVDVSHLANNLKLSVMQPLTMMKA